MPNYKLYPLNLYLIKNIINLKYKVLTIFFIGSDTETDKSVNKEINFQIMNWIKLSGHYSINQESLEIMSLVS